jgi:hypothetical protein
MRKLSLMLSIFACLTLFVASSFKAEPVNKPAKAKSALKNKKQTTYSFTLTANGNAAFEYYRIQFAGSNLNQTFPFSGGSASGIPAGTYTVAIFPATSAATHNFAGQSCANSYSGSGKSIIFNNVLVCSGGFFTIN